MMERDIIYVQTYSVHVLFTLVLNKQVLQVLQHALEPFAATCTAAWMLYLKILVLCWKTTD